MSGVLGQIRWPLFGKGEICGPRCLPRPEPDPRMVELQEAKEILAEVFGVCAEEVEEMIQRRLEEKDLWPERFSLEGYPK